MLVFGGALSAFPVVVQQVVVQVQILVVYLVQKLIHVSKPFFQVAVQRFHGQHVEAVQRERIDFLLAVADNQGQR